MSSHVMAISAVHSHGVDDVVSIVVETSGEHRGAFGVAISADHWLGVGKVATYWYRNSYRDAFEARPQRCLMAVDRNLSMRAVIIFFYVLYRSTE